MSIAAVCDELDALRIILAEVLDDCARAIPSDCSLRAPQVGYALIMAGDLLGDLLDVEPELASRHASPRVASVLALCYARTRDDAALGALLAEVRAFAPNGVAEHGRRTPPELDAVAHAWVSNEPGSRVGDPVLGLASGRRWRRVLAARSIARDGGPDLLDARTGDVDTDGVRKWLREQHPAIQVRWRPHDVE